jgi:surfeit locus 1 family protein
MYRFVLSPRWVVGHVLFVGLVVLFVNLGFWQLRRLEERREGNALVAERMAAPEQPLPQVLDAAQGEPARLSFRRVSASGRYLPDEEVLLGPRSINGRPGYHVLTPLDYTGGVVLVDRGWVPYELDRPPVSQAAGPLGPVEVGGILFPGGPAGGPGPSMPATGELDVVPRADLARLGEQVPGPLVPAILQLERQDPAQAATLPVPIPPPVLEEGSHLSYAVQWFLFAAIGLVGYPLLLRRTARDRQPESHDQHDSATGAAR